MVQNFIDSAAVTVLETGNTTVATIIVPSRSEVVGIEIKNSANSLDNLLVQGRVQTGATYITLAGNTSTDFTSENPPILAASGDITGLTAETGFFQMDVRGLDAIKIVASATGGTSTVTAYWNFYAP